MKLGNFHQPMTTSALERIQELESKHLAQIAAIKQEAISELVAKIAEAKRTLADLSDQYSLLTGKTLTGEKSELKRTRLSAGQKSALPDQVADALGKRSLALSDITAALPGIPASAIRSALKDSTRFKMQGTRGNARYSRS